MVDVTIVYWRDIPAQVIVGKGRRGSKRQLEERFEQAIDRAARMRMPIWRNGARLHRTLWKGTPPMSPKPKRSVSKPNTIRSV
jgi:Virulence factor